MWPMITSKKSIILQAPFLPRHSSFFFPGPESRISRAQFVTLCSALLLLLLRSTPVTDGNLRRSLAVPRALSGFQLSSLSRSFWAILSILFDSTALYKKSFFSFCITIMPFRSLLSGLRSISTASFNRPCLGKPFARTFATAPRNIINPAATTKTSERATLEIQNGPIFNGKSFGAKRTASGEAVFTTSLVGYPESLSDPSYRGQILVFTQPLIGNYGVPSSERDANGLLRYFESPSLQAAGVVVADVAEKYSHWTAVESLAEWCARENVPAISGVDTRAIVTFLRERGSSLARLTIGEEYDADQDEAFIDPEQINLVRQVSTKAPFHVGSDQSSFHVALLDCGVKENILRSLVGRGASVTVLPFDFPIHKVAQHFDGVFISNGPGDPTHCQETIFHLRKLMDSAIQIPIMGICLGHQLLALSAGAQTIKLKYGNRAHNIPTMDLTTQRCHITSQNHGYAVDVSTLPTDWKPYFTNLNDNSNEGIIHKHRPIFGTQFHPEAKGGPLDSSYLFDVYLDSVKNYHESVQAKMPRGAELSPLLGDLLGKERVGVDNSRN